MPEWEERDNRAGKTLEIKVMINIKILLKGKKPKNVAQDKNTLRKQSE